MDILGSFQIGPWVPIDHDKLRLKIPSLTQESSFSFARGLTILRVPGLSTSTPVLPNKAIPGPRRNLVNCMLLPQNAIEFEFIEFVL